MSQSFNTTHVAWTSQHHFYKWNQRKWLRTSFLLLRDYTFNTTEQNVFDKIYIRSDLRSKFPQWKCPPCVLVLVLWASVALLSLDRFHFFFIFKFILFCLNSSILLPQRFCCFFIWKHLKSYLLVSRCIDLVMVRNVKSLLIAWVKDSNIFYEFEKIAHTSPTKGKIVTFSYHLQKMSTVFIKMERVLPRI